MAEPIQLPLFPDQAVLARIRPERNEWRFYRLAVWPDLFGRTLPPLGPYRHSRPYPPRSAPRCRRRSQRVGPARAQQTPPRLPR